MNELVGLVNWSLPWVAAVAVLSLLLGIQNTVFSFLDVRSVWQFSQGIAFLVCAVQLFRLFLVERTYVQTEKEEFLGKAMAHLGGFWTVSSVALLLSALSLISKAGKENQPYLVSLQDSPILWITLPLLVIAIGLFASLTELKLPFVKEAFSKNIAAFAKVNLPRTRFVAFFAIWVGVLFISVYVLSSFLNQEIVTFSSLIWGVCFLASGAAQLTYWKTVREIHRNPSVVYFERTLERLNIYWLAGSVIAGVQFISSFWL